MKNNKKKGFTLVELLVVIAILAILATVATVGYTAFIESATVSNDENAAAQLNQFLAAVKADSNGPFYGKDINEDNIMELTQYILDDSGYGDLIPQAAKYGYHFYFDLDEEKYVLIGDKDERILSMSPLSMLFASAAGESTNGHPESCFTEGRRYFLVETGTELSELVAGFKNITTADGLKEYYAKVSDYKTDAKQSLTGLITLVEKTVFATAEGYLVVEDAGHTVLFVPANLDGVKLSGVKVNVLNNKATTPISSENPLITLGDGYVFNIPKPEMIFGNALWFDGEHYTPDENDEYTTTLKFNLSLEEIKAIVDQNFTNVVFELNDGKQYGYIDGAIVCLTDGTVVGEITTKLKVTSFTIGIQNINSEGKYSVALDKAETTYQMVATNFKSDDPHNPDNVPDTTVTWSLVEAPAGVSISESGVISGLAKGTIKVRASSNRTPATTADYEIRVGIIDDVTIDCTFNGETNQIAFDSNNESDTITHAFGTNNVYQFTAAHSTTLDDVTNYDTSCTWAVSDPDLAEITADGKLTIKKAGSFSVTFKYNKYESVERTINFVVTNKVTSFEIGIKDIDTVDPIYSLDLSKSSASYEMIIKSVGTDDGGNSLGNKTVTWSVLGDGISNDGNKVSFTKSGEFTVKATIDGITETFTFRVGGLTGIVVQYTNNGTTYTPAFGNDNATDTIAHSLGNNDTYEFVLTPEYNFGEAMPTLSPKYEISDETKATISGNTLTIKDAGAFSVTIYYVEYPETKYVVNFNSVASDVFNYENKDAFNFRYGTSNAGTILLKDGIDASKYTFELDTSNFNNQGTTDRAMTYTITDGVVKATFVGGGKAEIVAKYNGNEVDRVTIEIVTGAKNVHTGSDIVSGSMCLMNDVTSDSTMIIGKNQGLYGNSFTLTATEKAYYSNNMLIALYGKMENVNVVGLVVDNYYANGTITGNNDSTDNWKAGAVVYIYNGAVIDNCTISNGKYGVRVYDQTGEVTIRNTVINGGLFGLKVAGGYDLAINLENITIAQLRTQDMVGIGLYTEVTSSDGITKNISINITGDNNKLQHFVTESDINKLPSDYQTAFLAIWNDPDSTKYKYTCTYEGVETTLMNIGITARGDLPTINYTNSNLNGRLAQTTKEILGVKVQMLGYDKEKDTDNYVSGNIVSWLDTIDHSYGEYAEIAPVFSNIPTDQILKEITAAAPIATISKNELLGGFTATKYGKTFDIEIEVEKTSGDGSYQLVEGVYTFTGVASYKVTYTVADIYDVDNLGYGKEYTFEREIFVDYKQADPTITITNNTLESFSSSSIKNPSSLDLTGVQYMLEGTYNYDGFLNYDKNLDAVTFSLSSLNIVAKDYKGTVIGTEYITYSISGKRVGASKDSTTLGNFTVNTTAYGTSVTVYPKCNAPGGASSSDNVFIAVFDVNVTVEYEGRTHTETVRVAVYVEKSGYTKGW